MGLLSILLEMEQQKQKIDTLVRSNKLALYVSLDKIKYTSVDEDLTYNDIFKAIKALDPSIGNHTMYVYCMSTTNELQHIGVINVNVVQDEDDTAIDFDWVKTYSIPENFNLYNITEAEVPESDEEKFDITDEPDDEGEDSTEVNSKDQSNNSEENDQNQSNPENDEENFDMDEGDLEGRENTEDNQNEDSAPDGNDNSGDEDFDLPDEDAESDENMGEPDLDSGDDSNEENFDMDEGDQDNQDDTGEENDLSSEDSSGSEDPKTKLKQLEKDIFDQLSEDQKELKTKELKELYVDVYNNCDGIISMIGDIPKSEDTVKIFDYITNNLIDLKKFILDYMNTSFNSKTYIENMTNFQKYLAVFDNIKNVLEEVKNMQKN